MNRVNKIGVFVFLFLGLKVQAQPVWENISLTGRVAKLLNNDRIQSQKEQDILIARTFETKEGKIYVYLPPLSASVTISGTVYLVPNETHAKDSSRNLATLQSYSIILGNQVIPVQRGAFQLQIPNDPGTDRLSLQLKKSTGEMITNEQIPVSKMQTTGNSISFPPYMVSGDAAVISGNFDGDMKNTSVTVSGQNTELLAESSSRLYLKTPASYTGAAPVQCTEAGNLQTGKTNVLSLKLAADKTNLHRGQQTFLQIKISGLEGLKENVPVIITNTSPSTIALEGGNEQQFIVEPGKDAPSGMIELTRNIQSLKNGSFSVSVSILPFISPLRKQ